MATNMAVKEMLACFAGAFSGATFSTLVLDIFIRDKLKTQCLKLKNEEKKNRPFIDDVKND